MKMFMLACLVAVAAAAPQQVFDEFGNVVVEQFSLPKIRLISQRFVQDGRGNYEYGYEQDNGQKVEEVGRSFPGPEPGTGSISKDGSFEFISPEGLKFRVDYQADEGGFKPVGDHLPVPPTQLPEYAQLRAQNPELFIPSP
ncbi:endocuticle structural glycoprotein SgAbd-4-like isoform X1 [Pollicipes pollicipes]|uniref:endocuticle structural glycoprotein SgAbd-4-like isoform X1 n=2 Tax=Pollicipes pollicipes TaxID=41117 RepID=UPI0018856E2A|nr:endocuticle structural glycoprotein SgAbd-4-like isoform X1 [Pollicipes pollicipes]